MAAHARCVRTANRALPGARQRLPEGIRLDQRIGRLLRPLLSPVPQTPDPEPGTPEARLNVLGSTGRQIPRASQSATGRTVGHGPSRGGAVLLRRVPDGWGP